MAPEPPDARSAPSAAVTLLGICADGPDRAANAAPVCQGLNWGSHVSPKRRIAFYALMVEIAEAHLAEEMATPASRSSAICPATRAGGADSVTDPGVADAVLLGMARVVPRVQRAGSTGKSGGLRVVARMVHVVARLDERGDQLVLGGGPALPDIDLAPEGGLLRSRACAACRARSRRAPQRSGQASGTRRAGGARSGSARLCARMRKDAADATLCQIGGCGRCTARAQSR